MPLAEMTDFELFCWGVIVLGLCAGVLLPLALWLRLKTDLMTGAMFVTPPRHLTPEEHKAFQAALRNSVVVLPRKKSETGLICR